MQRTGLIITVSESGFHFPRRHGGLDKDILIAVYDAVIVDHDLYQTETVLPALVWCVRSIQTLLITVLFFSTPVFASVGTASPASTAQEGHNPDESPIEEIVVHGSKLKLPEYRQYVKNFILEIGKPTSPDYGLARWQDEVCIGVTNLHRGAAYYVIDRISLVALEVGLEVGAPGCRQNVQIIFVRDGNETARYLVDYHQRSLLPTGFADGATQGVEALSRFAASSAPVRWWQSTALLNRYDRVVLTDYSKGCRCRPVELNLPTRIWVPAESKFLTTHIIVDVSRLGNVSWRQLVDYLAMVVLVQINPEARVTGYDSILNLFMTDSPPLQMTEWDRSFLHSLYGLTDHLSPNMQQTRLIKAIIDNSPD